MEYCDLYMSEDWVELEKNKVAQGSMNVQMMWQ